ncbi:unnamed protein product [Adineta ricciae]|uniref:Uncharacterized protein n=1 Tax=Adineta ricciae TaxID=249248 RepID=A0A814W893_ADIRI|nr:unnamed protein product [Adineta ricciae]
MLMNLRKNCNKKGLILYFFLRISFRFSVNIRNYSIFKNILDETSTKFPQRSLFNRVHPFSKRERTTYSPSW